MSLDHEKFSAIGHKGIIFWNPISAAVLDQWIQELPLSASSRILDVGCGRAELLLRIIERYGCSAVGVDRAESSVVAARQSAKQRLSLGLLELRCEPFDAKTFASGTFDMAACVGSSHAVSGFEQSLRVLSSLVKPELLEVTFHSNFMIQVFR